MRPNEELAKAAPFRHNEELVNMLTHGVGMVGAIASGTLLIIMASLQGDAWKIVGSAVFATTLAGLYFASTFYHAARSERLKARLKVVDHCAIYLLIAGSYTPFMLVGLRGGWGWSLFGVIWGLAIAGVVFKLFFTGRFALLSTAIYIGMGWLAVIAAGPLVRNLSTETLVWLVAGGLAYTGGTAFYHNRRIPYAHAVWHLFVIAGSACHVVAVATSL